MAVKIQFRGDTAANWTSANPVLAEREIGLEVDTSKMKIGDGVTAWNSKGYANIGPQGPQGIQGIQGIQGNTGNTGNTGATGPGVVAGGSTNQVLRKIDGTDFNTAWSTIDKAWVALGNCDNTSDANKPVSTAQQTALNLKANLASPAFTGNPTTSELSSTGKITSSSPTAGIGYATGAGGAVTQSTSKSTATPTINKMCGDVTMSNASLAAGAAVTHTLTNSSIGANDLVICVHKSGGTLGAYTIVASAASGSATVTIRNNTAGALAEAVLYRFIVIKGAVS